jgi:aspartate racemase
MRATGTGSAPDSARIVLISVDFDQVAALQRAERWPEAAGLLARAGRNAQAGGADFVAICTNTMHLVADEVAAAVGVPLVHIIDETASAGLAQGWRTVGLLDTAYTMEDPFYADRLAAADVAVVVPNDADRAMIHAVIFDELCQGVVDDISRTRYLAVVERLAAQGAQAVVLGCTEIGNTLEHNDGRLRLPARRPPRRGQRCMLTTPRTWPPPPGGNEPPGPASPALGSTPNPSCAGRSRPSAAQRPRRPPVQARQPPTPRCVNA